MMRIAALLFLAALCAGCGSSTEPSESDPDASTEDIDSSEETGDVATPDATEDIAEPPPSLTETGPYAVGIREASLTYTPATGEVERTLRLLVWYPAETSEAETWKYMGAVAGISVEDATPVGEDLPILVYSHGSNGMAEASPFIMERFASHGWIAIAPDHTGNTIINWGAPSSMLLATQRPLDLTATLDWLENLPAEDPLAGRMGDGVAVTGHSFGGFTTFSVSGASNDMEIIQGQCEGEDPSGWCDELDEKLLGVLNAGMHDERVDALMPLAPGRSWQLVDGVADIDLPVLLMTSNGDASCTDVGDGDPYWASLDGAHDIRVRLTTGGHHTFAITCELMGDLMQEDGCGPGDWIEPDTAHPVIASYLLAFARRHVLGDTSVDPILTGAESLHPDITVEPKTTP